MNNMSGDFESHELPLHSFIPLIFGAVVIVLRIARLFVSHVGHQIHLVLSSHTAQGHLHVRVLVSGSGEEENGKKGR